MTSELSTRILNAVRAGSYEMTALLSLMRIEETESVPTAAVSCGRRPVLLVNPTYVRERCRTDEHLFLLVMHELHHVLLGHTRLFPRATLAHNIAFDAVINSMLVRRFPAQAYTSFFLRGCAGATGVLRLLAPPADDAIADPALRRLHHLLYDDDKVTSEEVFNAVVEYAAGQKIEGAGEVLLGSHGAEDLDGWGTEGPVDPEFVKAIRSIVEKWPPPERPIRGRSLSDLLTRSQVVAVPTSTRVLAVLRSALGAASNKRLLGPGKTRRSSLAQVALPTASDRRAAVSRAIGVPPLLYMRPVESARRQPDGRARVYVDVSGSMDPYLPYLYSALSSLRAHVEPEVCLFSTRIRTIPMADLVRGRRDSDGGTNVACVVDHLLAHRVRKALVVTDGYVGKVSPADRERLATCTELRVVLTPKGWREDLVEVAAHVAELPPLEG